MKMARPPDDVFTDPSFHPAKDEIVDHSVRDLRATLYSQKKDAK